MGRLLSDILTDFAAGYGLTSRPTDETQAKIWAMNGYRYFCSKRRWWFLKSNYNTVTDGTTLLPLPAHFKYLTQPKMLLVNSQFYRPIPIDEVDRYTLSGQYPVSLPTVGQPNIFYLDDAGSQIVFPAAPGTGLTVEMKIIHRVGKIRAATAAAGGSTTLTLDSAASSRDDYYNGMKIRITAGTGSGDVRTISDYVGSTKVATIDSAWSATPDSSSSFTIGDVLLVDDDETSIPEDFADAIIEYMMYEYWRFLTELQIAQEYKNNCDSIIAECAREDSRRKMGTNEHALSYEERAY